MGKSNVIQSLSHKNLIENKKHKTMYKINNTNKFHFQFNSSLKSESFRSRRSPMHTSCEKTRN